MTSEVDTRETEATARQMALAADTEVDRLAFKECAQAIAQERAARERAETALRLISENGNDDSGRSENTQTEPNG